ncbi:MAG TPA: rhomboid family intramembrane serine protease [Chitinophagaceae bacterium]|nr:rhomboid family intramembrane serine protease [Chitinophagaceae bacterium]
MTEFRPGRFEILPFVIKNLLIINALVFLAQMTFDGSNGGWLTDTFALHNIKSSLFKPHQLFTYMFMHGSFAHLFFNMFAVWMFGSTLENYWGPKKFLTYYIITGLGAAAMHLAVLYFENAALINDLNLFKSHPTFSNYMHLYNKYGLGALSDQFVQLAKGWMGNPSSYEFSIQAIDYFSSFTDAYLSVPTVGASGSVFGLLAAFGYLFPNSYVYFYFLFPMKAKWFVLLYAGLELFAGIRNSAGDNVAHFAHLGGALVGFLLVYAWNKLDRKNFY